MRWFVGMTVAGWLAVAAALAGVDQKQVLAGFQQNHPQASFYQDGTRITRVYGPAFGFGGTPEETAAGFVQDYAAMLGVDPVDLVPGNHFNDVLTQPLMYEPDIGDYKFTLVYCAQYAGGIPVYQADLRFLVRNVEGYPLVLVASSLRDLGGFVVPAGAAAGEPGEIGHAAALVLVPDLVNFGPSTYVVWAGIDNMVVPPTLAVQFVADNGRPASGAYEKYEFLADAATGQILRQQSLIIHTDVNGNVHGMATTIPKADICNPEVDTIMPYARVAIGSTTAYADANGYFTIPNSGTTPVTVTSYMAGKYFAVYDQAGALETLSVSVTPPGPADFMHNSANTSEYIRAQVNGYVQANVVRDFALTYNPTYPTIYNQLNFTVNVNLNDVCNAYYDGSSINFYRSGGGCANTAFSNVVHHEYGHHLVESGGSGEGAYGEGMADCMAMLIAEDPILGYGFENNCNAGIRSANNSYQYPCTGEIHDCGQLLSGCVWSTRNALMVTHPTDYMSILSNLTVNSILLHTGESITPQITIDFLTVDDDNGNIYDGTPHYPEICTGFNAHNMDCPALQLLAFNFPNGRPNLIDPAGGTTVRVVVTAISAQPQPGTGTFYYKIGSGSWTSVAMTEVQPNVYDAVFPPVACGTGVKYYFSAKTTANQTVYNPATAPTDTYSTTSGYAVIVTFQDDFETNQGWTVTAGATTGNWERADPQQTTSGGQIIQPGDDHSPNGTLCYVTQAAAGSGPGSYDVDGGPTHLISPAFNLAGTDATISYWRWYHISTTWNDQFVAAVSNNNGTSWVTVETLTDRQEWTYHEFRVSQFVTPTAQVKVRFTVSDNPNDSLVESCIDDFAVETVDCTPPFEKGDLNCDGAINAFDIDPFVLALTDPAAYQAQYPNCNYMLGDINADGAVNAFDIDPFVDLLTP